LKSSRTGTALAAGLADEARLDIGEPEIVWPSITTDCGRMAAPVVSAIDQDAAHTHLAHLDERDLGWAGDLSQRSKPTFI
jgi:hypothetical protein